MTASDSRLLTVVDSEAQAVIVASIGKTPRGPAEAGHYRNTVEAPVVNKVRLKPDHYRNAVEAPVVNKVRLKPDHLPKRGRGIGNVRL